MQDPEKVIKITRIETRVVMLKLKYGTDVGDSVDDLIRKSIGNEPFGHEHEHHRSDVEKLRARLVKAGFLPAEFAMQESEADKLKANFKADKEAKRFKGVLDL